MNAVIALILRILFLILTYTFVGWIAFIILKDLQVLFRQQKNIQTAPITLRAIANDEPIEIQLVKPEIILGRDPDCDFSIADETISLRHCRLTYHHKQWWANDLDSTNGSFLNESPIETATIITDGDQLRLGKITINIHINQ